MRTSRLVAGTKRAGGSRTRDTGPDAGTRALVVTRAGGRCERCGAVPFGIFSIHHRLPRRMGGTSDPAVNGAANLVYLCGSGTTGCHGEMESQRNVAYLAGLLLRSGQDPASEPVKLCYGWVYLTPEGTKVPA